MTKNKVLYYAPRILALLFVIFLSLFSLDVFSEYKGFEIILPLLIHNIPAFLLLVVTIIAWKHELIGAGVFLGAAALYVWDVGFNKHWTWYAFIAGPAALVGILFIVSWRSKDNAKSLEDSTNRNNF